MPCRSDHSKGEWEGRPGRIFLEAMQYETARQGCRGALGQTQTVRGVSRLLGAGPALVSLPCSSQTKSSPCGECGLCAPGFQSAAAGARGQLGSLWLEVLRHILMVTISYLNSG